MATSNRTQWTSVLRSKATSSDDPDSTKLGPSSDGAWPKRGTGRQYNSLPGHSAFIGEKTGKCVTFDVKSKRCRTCSYAESHQTPVPKHDCYKKLTGSAKAVEPAMATTMAKKVEEHNMMVHVSPGKHTAIQAARKQQKRDWVKSRESTPSFKKRRLSQKSARQSQAVSQEIGEDDTYETSVDLGSADTENIPPPSDCAGKTKVFWDLETTGFGHAADIVQIAAKSETGIIFNRYILPYQPISPGASKVTGITVQGNQLLVDGQVKSTCSIHKAVLDFMDFLDKFDRPVLFGHNSKSFDLPVLHNTLKKTGMMKEFSLHVSGFIDTLAIAKKNVKNVSSYKQETLVQELLHKSYKAHDALADADSLCELYQSKLSDSDNLNKYMFSLETVDVSKSLQNLVKTKVLSKATRVKLANCGLGLDHLKSAYKRDPEQGISKLFSEPVGSDGKCRVTKNKNVIEKLQKYLSSL